MDRQAGKQEIMAALTGCSKLTYRKEEILSEMLKLQAEMARITFGESVDNLESKRLWDITRQLKSRNRELGNVAAEELDQFERLSHDMQNHITSEFSGVKGERAVSRTLESLDIPHLALHNVEFVGEMGRTEIDAIVLTSAGITVIEVKNSKHPIYINKNGNYFRISNRQHPEGSIAKKMAMREDLICKALLGIGYRDVPIQSVVVFTNHKIEFTNECREIKACYNNALNYYIKHFSPSGKYTESETAAMAEQIHNVSSINGYSLDFNIAAFKDSFATVMAILEETETGGAANPVIVGDGIMSVNNSETLVPIVIPANKADATDAVKNSSITSGPILLDRPDEHTFPNNHPVNRTNNDTRQKTGSRLKRLAVQFVGAAAYSATALFVLLGCSSK